jgi:hypothetical protein
MNGRNDGRADKTDKQAKKRHAQQDDKRPGKAKTKEGTTRQDQTRPSKTRQYTTRPDKARHTARHKQLINELGKT